MALHRSIDGGEPLGPEPLTRPPGPQEIRRSVRPGHLATGTLACPACDAPVAPGPDALAPADGLGCPVCGHTGAVRDFLSLTAPARPARVDVRVVAPVPATERRARR